MAKYRLSREDAGDLGFALSSLTYSVVTFSEFKQWIYHVIEHEDAESIPSFLFEILDINDKFDFTLRAWQIIGFHPSWDGNDDEDDALCGIGFKRFPNYHADGLSKQEAFAALARNPGIEKRFRETFPFIEF